MTKMTRWGAGIGLLSAGIVSIGFSAWQFGNNANGNTWSSNWDNYCNDWPSEFLRRKLFFFFLRFTSFLLDFCFSFFL
jgi:hypothetical protein